MNTVMDLAHVGPGFSDPVGASQAVFRAGLEAFSRPGKPVVIESDANTPEGVRSAACALLLALLDQDTALFVSPSHAAGVAEYFRFHTGCALTGIASEADFLLYGAADAWPDLTALRIGTEYAPDRSATLIREVDSLADGSRLELTGPGIPGSTVLQATQLDSEFIRQWDAARVIFPRGVDIFLTCGSEACGLPRTTRATRITQPSEAN